MLVSHRTSSSRLLVGSHIHNVGSDSRPLKLIGHVSERPSYTVILQSIDFPARSCKPIANGNLNLDPTKSPIDTNFDLASHLGTAVVNRAGLRITPGLEAETIRILNIDFEGDVLAAGSAPVTWIAIPDFVQLPTLVR